MVFKLIACILALITSSRSLSLPSSCESSSLIFKEYLSNFTISEDTSKHSILLPARDDFLKPYLSILQQDSQLRDKVFRNHVLTSHPERGGLYTSLGGLLVKVESHGDQLVANGFDIKPCGSSQDGGRILFFAIDGVLMSPQSVLNFRLPALNEDELKVLKNAGSRFYELWASRKDELEESSTRKFVILVPEDSVVDEINEDQSIQLLASQVIPTGKAPFKLEEHKTIYIKNLMGENISVSISNEKIFFNGGQATKLMEGDKLSIYSQNSSLLVTDKYISENPAFEYNGFEVQSALLPNLHLDIRRALKQMRLTRFLNLWSKAEEASQTAYAKSTENLCALPKKVGPCTSSLPMFYFDGDECRPFVYGGCDGNLNRFDTLRACTETCIKDPTKKSKIMAKICSLPYFQPPSSSIKCEKEVKMFGYLQEKGYCAPLAVNSSLACFVSESLFKNFKTCRDICRQTPIESVEKPSDPICHLPKNCQTHSSMDYLPKWAYDEASTRCLPTQTECSGPGLYEYEVECWQACGRRPDEVLTIFAPTDKAISYLPSEVWTINSTESVNMLKKYVLPHFLRERKTVERPTVYTGSDFRIVLMHHIGKRVESLQYKETPSHYLRSSSENKFFASFNGLPELRREFLKKNSFVKYNDVYESIYNLLNAKRFGFVHKAISQSDAQNKGASNGRNATARGFCRQKLSLGEPNNYSPQAQTRYYYNEELGSCQSFLFSGIGGNSNNFHSFTECSDFCGRFEGLVAEVRITGNLSTYGRALLVQPTNNQSIYLEASFRGLKPNADFSLEAGLTKLLNLNSTEHGTIVIKENIRNPPDGLEGLLRNQMILREIKKYFKDSEIVAHGPIVRAPNVIEAKTNIIHESNEDIRGEISLRQEGPYAPVFVHGFVEGIMEGHHGFHIHEIGSTADGCKGAGSHFNPHGNSHGGPEAEHRHVGDLGNVQVYWGSNLQVHLWDDLISLYESTNSILGRTIVIHEGRDDLGVGGDFSSLTTGNAGPRVACGIIEKKPKIEEESQEETLESGYSGGRIFFVPNDAVMKLIVRSSLVEVNEDIREFAFCHLSYQSFDFESINTTTECGIEVSLHVPDGASSYEAIVNGVRADKVIRDGKNTFIVIPFLLYANEEITKDERSRDTSFKKSAHAMLPPAEESYGDTYYPRRQYIEFKQDSPQSSLILKTDLEGRGIGRKDINLRVLQNVSAYPTCPEYRNNSVVDFGTIQLSPWSNQITRSTHKGSLYGPDSIIGGVIVLYDGEEPLICGRILAGEFRTPCNIEEYEALQSNDIPLVLPPQDPELKSRAHELGITLFFDAWDAALKNGIAVTDTDGPQMSTLVTMDNTSFQGLMPRPQPEPEHACNIDLFFQHKILGMMVIPGKLEVASVQDKGVIIPSALGDYGIMFSSNQEGTVNVRGMEPLKIHSTNKTALYLMSRSMFMSSYFLGPGDVFGSFDRAIFRVKNPDW